MSHEVKVSMPDRDLGKADIEFSVKKNGKKFGTLKVSKGSVVWVQKDDTYGFKMWWTAFDEMMRANGRHEKS